MSKMFEDILHLKKDRSQPTTSELTQSEYCSKNKLTIMLLELYIYTSVSLRPAYL
jgi:hypothetical protein